MSTPHKHADVIKAWADGAQIQVKGAEWIDIDRPDWLLSREYRIKPAPIRRIVRRRVFLSKEYGLSASVDGKANVEFIFDEDTGAVLEVKLIK